METLARRAIPPFLLAAALALTGASLAAAPHLSSRQDKGAKSARPALASDKGKFRILLDGQPAGSEEFEISGSGASWTARGSSAVHVPGSGNTKPMDVKTSGTLQLSGDATPLHYEWSVQAQKKTTGTVSFQNGTAKTATDFGGSAFAQDFTFPTPRVAILDNNLYYQYAVLARLYDWKAAGQQTISVLIPQDGAPGEVTVESLGQQDLDGKKYDALRVRSTDLEILLYLDSQHRLMRLEVPSSKVIVERQ